MDVCARLFTLEVFPLLVLGVVMPAFVLAYVLLYCFFRLMLHDNPDFALKIGRKKLLLEPLRKLVGVSGFLLVMFVAINYIIPVVSGYFYARNVEPFIGDGRCSSLSLLVQVLFYVAPLLGAFAAVFIFRRLYHKSG